MNTTKTAADGVCVISLDGRLDTITAPQVQPEIDTAIDEYQNVALDFSGVTYISSAGLRILLAGHKRAAAAGGSLKLAHVSGQIMEIFEMTGFTGILKREADHRQ
ncbi:MAG: STAS domain-containing protein [Synergistaceae bacterium]|jgi:anti-anti-sigma factor|nr:STAS domain-containing protein [Synergistaceae bacterium]